MSAQVPKSIQSSARKAPACEPSLVAGRRASPGSDTQLGQEPRTDHSGARRQTTVDREHDTVDVRRVGGQEERDGGSDLLGTAEAPERRRGCASPRTARVGARSHRRRHAGAADRPRAHRVHPDPVRTEVDRRRADEVEDAALRRVVRPHVRVAERVPDTEAVTTIAPPPAARSGGERRAHAEHDAAEVDGDHPVEVSMGSVSIGPAAPTPALSTSPSRRPKWSTAASTIAALPASVAMSATHVATVAVGLPDDPTRAPGRDPRDDVPPVRREAGRRRPDRCPKPRR